MELPAGAKQASKENKNFTAALEEERQLVAELRAKDEYQWSAMKELLATNKELLAQVVEDTKQARAARAKNNQLEEALRSSEQSLVEDEYQWSALIATNEELVAQVVEDLKQKRAARAKNNQLEEALRSSEQSLVEAATRIQALEQAASRSSLPEARLSSSSSPPSARVDSTRVAAASVGGGVGTSNDNNSSDPDRLLEVERQKSRALAQAADVIKLQAG